MCYRCGSRYEVKKVCKRGVDGGKCEPCIEIENLKARMADESESTALHAASLPFMHEMNKIHSPLIHQFPFEISSAIFADYAQSWGARPLYLGAVCKIWREIAWNTPRVWSDIKIYFPKRMRNLADRPQLVQEWLQRVGDSIPLNVQLRFPVKEIPLNTDETIFEYLDIFNKYIQRCHSLDICIPLHLLSRIVHNITTPGSESFLQYLIIDTNGSSESNAVLDFTAVKPRYVILDSVHVRAIKLGSWDCLTHFSGNNLTVDDCLEIIRWAPNMLAAYFYMVGSEEFEVPSSASAPFVHRQLRVLHFITYESPLSFFNHVRLPNLEEFILDGDMDLPAEMLLSFFTESAELNDDGGNKKTSNKLRRLSILNFVFGAANNMLQILSGLPNLDYLFVEDPSDFEFDSGEAYPFSFFNNTLLARFEDVDHNGRPTILPNLTTLKYKGMKDFSWKKLPDAFSKRSLTFGGVFESISLWFMEEKLLEIEAKDFRSVALLRQKGVNVSIKGGILMPDYEKSDLEEFEGADLEDFEGVDLEDFDSDVMAMWRSENSFFGRTRELFDELIRTKQQ